jgi:hypothetical protein
MKDIDLLKLLLKSERLEIVTPRLALIGDEEEGQDYYYVVEKAKETDSDAESERKATVGRIYVGKSFEKALLCLKKDIDSYI